MRARTPTSRAAVRIRVSALDAFCALAAPLLALCLSNAIALSAAHASVAVAYCAISFVLSLIAFLLFRLHDGMARYLSVHEALDILKASVFSQTLTIVALFTITRLDGIPRSTPIYQALILAMALIGIRALAQALQNGSLVTDSRDDGARENIILIGATHRSSLYIQLLDSISQGERKVIALLDDRPKLIGRTMAGVRILAPPHYLKSVIDEFEVHGIHTDRVIIGDEKHGLAEAELKEIEEVCDQNEIKLDFLPQLMGLDELPPTAVNETTEQAPTPAPNVELPRYFKYRQVFDSLASLVLIVAFCPLLLIAAGLVLLDVGPPVLFWQQRLGQGGRRFLLHKFRTQRAPYDWRGNPIADRNKLSVTGRVMRQTRLDEFPQLLNILVGDMALIGPRPLLPEDQPADPAIRLMVRPGITGWAQVNGGKFLTPQEKNQYDEFYVRNASLWFDLRILLMTLRALFRFTLHSDHEVAAENRVGFGKTADTATNGATTRAAALVHRRKVQSPPLALAASHVDADLAHRTSQSSNRQSGTR